MSHFNVTAVLTVVKCTSKRSRRFEKKLVLDVDMGVDDAQAIMMALAAPNVEVLGITCVSGNTSLENSSRNTLRVLKVCQRLEVGLVERLLTSINNDLICNDHTILVVSLYSYRLSVCIMSAVLR